MANNNSRARGRSGRRVPEFTRIANCLRKEVLRDYEPGDRLPTESALSERFKVSNLTVRQALTVLEQEGMVERRQGSGTYVLAPHEAKRHAAILCELDLAHPLTSYYYRRVVRQVRRALDEAGVPNRLYAGYRPPVGDAVPGELTCQSFLHDIEMGRITGVVTVATNPAKSWVDPVREAGIPITGTTPDNGVAIEADREQAFQQALDYLQNHGCRRLAYFGWGDRDLVVQMVKQSRLSFPEELILTKVHPLVDGAGREAVDTIWQNPELRPDALLVGDEAFWNDTVVGLLQHGIQIPDDLRIVLRTQKGLPHLSAFPVCRLDFDVDQFAAALANCLVKRLQGRNLKREVIRIPFHWNEEFNT